MDHGARPAHSPRRNINCVFAFSNCCRNAYIDYYAADADLTKMGSHKGINPNTWNDIFPTKSFYMILY